jgi:selenocysteine lyase/cysteine desulfurase
MASTPLISCQRDAFDIPRDVAYLNCAYLAPFSRAVLAAGADGIAAKLRPWRLKSDDFFTESDLLRARFASLIGAAPRDIALVPSVSFGTAVAAKNLPLRPGRRVLLLAEQFPSNVYVWRDLARRTGGEVLTVPRPDGATWTDAVLAHLDERVAIAALPQVHWVDGRLLDLAAVGRRAREVGAALVLDLTQSLGALPFELATVDPDFIACAGYKWLLGPYGTGFLYAAPRRQQGEPLEHGWVVREGARDFARLVDYRDDLQPGAVRFDVGERSNFALVPPMRAALEQILEWRVGRIAASLAAMTAAIAERARGLGFEALPAAIRAGHYLGLRRPGGLPDHIVERLAAGGVHVSRRGDALRITPHLYNDALDLDRLFAALEGLR